MSIAEVERWLASVLNYDLVSVDETAAAEGRRGLAHAGMPGLARICGARKKAAPEKPRGKTQSLHLTRFVGDGGLKMCNNAAERAMRQIALGGNNYFFGSGAGGRHAAIIAILIETAKLDDVAGALSSSPSRGSFKNGHGRRTVLSFRGSEFTHLPERGGRLVLFGALRARFFGAGLLFAGMRIFPGGDRLRLRG
jgi:hypothetical protein